jgi:hypothetical protein
VSRPLSWSIGERAMITLDVTVSDACLRITCAGDYGISEDNLLSGRLVQETIQRHLDRVVPLPSEVIIDFTRVEGGTGDGPIWSVLPAYRRGLKVTYLVSGSSGEFLQALLCATGMRGIINLVVVENA